MLHHVECHLLSAAKLDRLAIVALVLSHLPVWGGAAVGKLQREFTGVTWVPLCYVAAVSQPGG